MADNKRHSSQQPHTAPKRSLRHPSSLFAVPAPIRELFARFPLITYAANELPYRARRDGSKHALHIFTTPLGARMDAPSYNPGCLKWQVRILDTIVAMCADLGAHSQTYLKFLEVPFTTIPSSNHASPSGALPFVLPASSSEPVPISKIDTWLKNQLHKDTSAMPIQQQPYASLLSQPIRLAYLHALYLDDEAFRDIATRYYIHPSSSHSLVRTAMAPSLRAAALDQILSARPSNAPEPFVDLERLYADADEAFDALSTLLEGRDWFASTSVLSEDAKVSHADAAKSEQPGIFDASVFAYTHVILTLFAGLSDGSPGARLRQSITRRSNLLDHHTRIAKRYYHSPR